ncbi:MAG: MurR/RpiR family transcriptional regulator, partial [Lachnospiraceae bacterium]|nr:MurR/RpiR family transcriptional regulator [Lachnospiraceae bacterium]
REKTVNPIEQIEQNFEALSKTEQRVAKVFLEDPTQALGSNLTNLAKRCSVSNAAVIRMCQRLGYDGFSEFKFSMNRYLLTQGAEAGREEGAFAENESDASADQNIINTYIKYMKMVPEFVSQEQMNHLARDIVNAKRLAIWGVNRTAQSAKQLSDRLSRLGIYNKMTDDFICMNDDANILTHGDACVLLTMNGRGNPEYPQMIANARSRGCTTWLITMNPKIKAAKEAENIITLPWVSRASKENFFEDQIIVYLFIELLLYEVVRIMR